MAALIHTFTPARQRAHTHCLPSVPSEGLKKAGFTTLTPIQALSLPLSLQGKDVLASAPTGSGKTLSFLLPILERLYSLKWGGAADGLGALIISPTRELAIQIFEVLRKIGVQHTSLSAGLVIGGKDLKSEQSRLARINILVATPGRLLQHMDQTPDFDTSKLQVLVLDEADRCLDMGFENTLNAILENLPQPRRRITEETTEDTGGKGKGKAKAWQMMQQMEGRQTLLFSATQTKKVKDLARLSLEQPEYVAVKTRPGELGADAEGGASGETGSSGRQFLPKQLEQHYMLVSLDRKLDVLYSFLRTHLNSKLLLFFSSCRQVQFAFECFCKLRPGIPLLALHGKQKQAKRLQIYSEFSKAKHACLIATDIAARGLDFPSVDWVVQVDAPEDAETYVHRVGRTARYDKAGNSLLFLLEAEKEGALARLAEKGIEEGSTINQIKARESKLHSIANQLQSFLFQDPQLKYLGQKAFVSYVRSLHLQQKGRSGTAGAVDVTALPLEKFAEALGLPGAPKVKFVKEAQKAKKAEAAAAKKQAKKAAQAPAPGAEDQSDESGDEEEDEAGPSAGKVRTRYDRMFERKNEGVLSEHYQKLVRDEEDDDEDSDSEAAGRGLLSDDDDEDDASEEETAFASKADADGDDFLTLKRADHGLEGSDDEGAGDAQGKVTNAVERDIAIRKQLEREAKEAAAENISKRQLKAGKSKKAMASAGKRGQGEKLVFDDEGQAHALYEMQGEEDFKAAGDVAEQQRAFAEAEKERLMQSDVVDKERMRQQRKEKKRKAKERERRANGDVSSDEEGGAGVELAPLEDDEDDYVEPDYILPDESEEEHEPAQEKPSKKRRKSAKSSEPADAARSLQQDEELALQLLAGGA